MRISDWSSDVCSSDLDGKYVMTKGFVENEPGSSITQVTFGKRLSQLLTAGQEYSWGVRMFTGQSKPGDALDPDDYEIGRAAWRKECVSTCRSRWSPAQ